MPSLPVFAEWEYPFNIFPRSGLGKTVHKKPPDPAVKGETGQVAHGIEIAAKIPSPQFHIHNRLHYEKSNDLSYPVTSAVTIMYFDYHRFLFRISTSFWYSLA